MGYLKQLRGNASNWDVFRPVGEIRAKTRPWSMHWRTSRLEVSKQNSVHYGDNGWWPVTRAGEQQSSPTTSVIVVMFNSELTLNDCLNSIPSTSEVVLVDQASSDASVSMARQIRPDARLISAGANRGFGAGCN